MHKGHSSAVVMAWLVNQNPQRARLKTWELLESGEEACGLTPERSYRMYGSQVFQCSTGQRPIVEEAWNRQVESTAHPIEMSHPNLRACTIGQEPSSHGSKDGSRAWPNGMRPLLHQSQPRYYHTSASLSERRLIYLIGYHL